MRVDKKAERGFNIHTSLLGSNIHSLHELKRALSPASQKYQSKKTKRKDSKQNTKILSSLQKNIKQSVKDSKSESSGPLTRAMKIHIIAGQHAT